MLETEEKKPIWKSFAWRLSALLVIAILGIYFLNGQLTVLSNQLQDKKSQFEALKNRETNINELQSGYYKIKDEIDTVTSILPDEENVASFVEYLEKLTKRFSTNLELVFDDKINTQVESNKYLVLTLSISGPGEAVKNVWQSLEKGPYFINVSSFTLETTNGLGTDSKLKLITKVYTNDQFKIIK